MPARYIEIDLFRYIDIQTGKSKREVSCMQGINEWVFDWSMDYGWEWDMDVDSDEIDEAIENITKNTPVSKTWLLENRRDEIIDDIKRAKHEALRGSYESGWIKAYYSQLVENIRDSLREAGIDTDEIYTCGVRREPTKWDKPVLMGDKIEPSQWEHNTIRVKVTRQELKDILGYKSDYEPIGWGSSDEWMRWEWLADELTDSIDYKPVDTEHIDYYGNAFGDTDDWLEYFSDYSEIGYEVDKSLKARLSQLKAYIINDVPMHRRFA